MKNFLKKIEAADFRGPAKRLLIVTLAVVLICGALSAYMFRTQISEMAAPKRAGGEAPGITEVPSGRGENGEFRAYGAEDAELSDSGPVTRPTAAAAGVGIASVALCGLCALAWWLLAAAWLYKASAEAGMNRALWTVLGLLANLIAVLAFLIVRGRMTRCPSCGVWQKAALYCAACGAKLSIACPGCGGICAASNEYCPNCKTALKGNGTAGAGNA